MPGVKYCLKSCGSGYPGTGTNVHAQYATRVTTLAHAIVLGDHFKKRIAVAWLYSRGTAATSRSGCRTISDCYSTTYSIITSRHGARICQNGIDSKPPVANCKPCAVDRKLCVVNRELQFVNPDLALVGFMFVVAVSKPRIFEFDVSRHQSEALRRRLKALSRYLEASKRQSKALRRQ